MSSSPVSYQATETKPGVFLSAAIAFLIIAPITCSLRFYTRRITGNKLGPDDWLVLPATICVVGCSISMIVGEHLHAFCYPLPPAPAGINPSQWPSDSRRWNEQLQWSFFLCQIAATGFTKLSVIFFIRRIFVKNVSGQKTVFGFIVNAMIVLITLWCLTFVLWFLFSCAPNWSARWTTALTHQEGCPTDDVSDLALAITDFVTDFLVICLPVWPLYHLQMNLRKKIAIASVFSVGFVALVAAIVRLVQFIYELGLVEHDVDRPETDTNLLVTQGLYWSILEAGLAQICCSIPTFLVLFRGRLRPSYVREYIRNHHFTRPMRRASPSKPGHSITMTSILGTNSDDALAGEGAEVEIHMQDESVRSRTDESKA